MRQRWVQSLVMRQLTIIALLLPLLLAGCPAPEEAPPSQTAESAPVVDTAPVAASAVAEAEAPAEADASEAAAMPPEPPAELGSPRQLILIYSGDTLARAEANLDVSPPEGGLCALAATIVDYQGQIAEYNRRRVENSGGDPTGLGVDYERSLLGEHPYMLLDYGGWGRPNDFAGAPYVELYLAMFEALAYTAVGDKLYARLQPERWQAYRRVAPEEFRLLVSAGERRQDALPAVEIVTREVYGKRWGIVSVPLPPPDDPDPLASGRQYVESAAALLAQHGCDYSVLLMSEGPSSLYQTLADEAEGSGLKFTVVIGAPPGLAADDGYYGSVETTKGAMLLPELTGGGREIGVCHLYFSELGDKPEMYYFSRKPCLDDIQQPWPFRPQVAEAVTEHDQLVADWMGG